MPKLTHGFVCSVYSQRAEQWVVPEYPVTCRWPTHCLLLHRDSEKPGSLGRSSVVGYCNPVLLRDHRVLSEPESGFCVAAGLCIELD